MNKMRFDILRPIKQRVIGSIGTLRNIKLYSVKPQSFKLRGLNLYSLPPRKAAMVILVSLIILSGIAALVIISHGRHIIQNLHKQANHPSIGKSVPLKLTDNLHLPKWSTIDKLQASLTHPAFYPDRKIPTEEKKVAPVINVNDYYRLAGTVVSGEQRYAIIENRKTKESKRIGIGETMDVLMIVNVSPDSVTVNQSGQIAQLHLDWAPSPTTTPRRTVVTKQSGRNMQTNTRIQQDQHQNQQMTQEQMRVRAIQQWLQQQKKRTNE